MLEAIAPLALPGRPGSYRGPERRAAPQAWDLLIPILDEVDYGIVALVDGTEVAHANRTARAELNAEHALQIVGRQLRTRQPKDAPRLQDALLGASQRGLRRLLSLAGGADYVNILPLPGHAVMVQMSKRRLSQRLTVQCYAREKALTTTETRVLEELCEGLDPRDIAELHEVGLATVRTQIGSIRAKTGAQNIRALVRKVAMLPPMVSLLAA